MAIVTIMTTCQSSWRARGGTIKPGRHLKVAAQPLNNLYLAMLDRVGVSPERLGDSSGRLGQLDG